MIITFHVTASRMNKVLELQSDDKTIILKDNNVEEMKQMWTRRTVDEVGNWFIWSNAEGKSERDKHLVQRDAKVPGRQHRQSS